MSDPGSTKPRLSDFLADELHRQSDQLVETWLDRLIAEVRLRPARSMPRQAILDHIPRIMRGIAEFVRMPIDSMRHELSEDIRLHARLRLEQGYDIEELLVEYEVLNHLVTDAMTEALEGWEGECEPKEIAAVFLHLREGLGTLGILTVGDFREVELQQRGELQKRLAEYGRVLAHELKAPLQAITLSARMLGENADAAEQAGEQDGGNNERYIDVVRRSVNRLSSLIDEVRVLAYSEDRRAEDRWIPLDRAVSGVVEELSLVAEDRGVDIQVEDPLPEVQVLGFRVEIVVLNLVSNAVKYADPSCSTKWVRISAALAGDIGVSRGVEIRVSDNGLGIPERLHSQVFQRRFRAHPQVDEGTGLGLSISRSLVEGMAGEIDFESTEGSGSTFWFTVPVAGEPEEE